MKYLKYNILQNVLEKGNPVLVEKTMSWNEVNEELAKMEAYHGEYTIEEDGVYEDAEPTQLDRIEAQVTYTAMMTDTMLEV